MRIICIGRLYVGLMTDEVMAGEEQKIWDEFKYVLNCEYMPAISPLRTTKQIKLKTFDKYAQNLGYLSRAGAIGWPEH